MNEILVAYDISDDAIKEGVSGYLESFPVWYLMQESVYIIQAAKRYDEVYDNIKPDLGINDHLVVIDITKSDGQYNGYIKKSGDN